MTEIKCFDYTNYITAPSACSWAYVSAVVRGYGSNNRIGNRICVKRIEIYMYPFVAFTRSLTNPCLGRFMLYIDAQPTGALPASGADMVGASGLPFLSPIQWTMRNRFIPVYDVQSSSSLSYGGSGIGQDKIEWYQKNFNCDLILEFDDNSGTITDSVANAICLFAAGYNVNATENPRFYTHIRLLFEDA